MRERTERKAVNSVVDSVFRNEAGSFPILKMNRTVNRKNIYVAGSNPASRNMMGDDAGVSMLVPINATNKGLVRFQHPLKHIS